jgi:hypothetical protein
VGSVERISSATWVRSPVLLGVAGVLVIGALAWPLLFSGSYFNADWLEQPWFIWKQSQAIRANHLPSMFLDYSYGVFYPHYAFYGGTLYALTGALSLAFGDAPLEAYVLTYLLGFLAAYGGWYWLARICRLGRWWAHVPGLVFVTSSYYLTLIYARGDWPEFLAVSVIPSTLAAGVSVLRAQRLRLWPALALSISSIVFFGSHSLTLVWGSTLIALIGAAILICVPQARREVTRAGVIRVAGLVIPALLVDAWFLLPAAAYESKTLIATEYPLWRAQLRGAMQLVSAAHLFTLSRASVEGLAFALSLPVLTICWGLVGLVILLRRGLREAWARVLLICAGTTVALIVLMTHAGLLLALPRAYATLQFSYRLESYVLLALSATVLATLVLARRGGRAMRAWMWVLLPVLGVSVVGAIQQAGAHPRSGVDRYAALRKDYESDSPGTGEALSDYFDVRLPVMAARPAGAAAVDFDPGAVRNDRISRVVHLQPGALLYTNLQGPPGLVHVAGARIAGVTREAYDVLEIDRHPGAGRDTPGRGGSAAETISLSPAHSLPVVLGRALTLVGAVALVVQFAALAIRRRRAARDPGGAARSW